MQKPNIILLADMNWGLFLKSLVLIILMRYFASKIIAAREKLLTRKVGTLTSDKNEDTLKDYGLL